MAQLGLQLSNSIRFVASSQNFQPGLADLMFDSLTRTTIVDYRLPFRLFEIQPRRQSRVRTAPAESPVPDSLFYLGEPARKDYPVLRIEFAVNEVIGDVF